MIEIVSRERCIGCDRCVEVCPTNVFDTGPGGVPLIARQGDCQTCFMCEAYCPVDALFVAPQPAPVGPGSPLRDEEHVTRSGLLGGYRRQIGWGHGRTPGALHAVGPELPRTPPPRAQTPVETMMRTPEEHS
ncbi:4Fe-4S ferredoxin [Spongiactinospora rosea]|uniref:4Fe-4S ferredoxin n=1 Tax=Spongiactinospora rosea TaxID=2248750 RepID=A0A366LSW1_9ACTN|nr:ferredoxin family protein [Spongiactinospora rosea]RBQ16404.1 4Fe-4S ferredoxin [Spongiactinospora rosea]